MQTENEKIYPNCHFVTRKVEVLGLTKLELIQKLQQHSVRINSYGEKLFSDDRFTTSDSKYSLDTVELNLEDLGFPEGATMDQIFKRANQLGLELCPIEMGAYLRLQYLDQPEEYIGNHSQQHQAPSGSVTVASKVLSDDEDFPKGFYLRKMDGVLWLRGYRADFHLHVWNPNDVFIFVKL
jgi:hypothetical protein